MNPRNFHEREMSYPLDYLAFKVAVSALSNLVGEEGFEPPQDKPTCLTSQYCSLGFCQIPFATRASNISAIPLNIKRLLEFKMNERLFLDSNQS